MDILLIIHDNILINTSITNFLVSKGYEVSSFTNGEDALNQTKKEKCDLVIVDLNLPNFTIHDTIKEIRAKCKRVPIIGLTTLGLRLEKNLAEDFFAILPSDIDEEELENVIKEALGKRKG